MTDKFVVGYDGSEAAQRALDFAVNRAQAQGAMVVIAHVMEWSPYSFLTPNEIEERHQRRKEEMERAEKVILEPVRQKLADQGIPVETLVRYGHIADTLCSIAEKQGAKQMFVGRDGHSGLSSRVFGSVAGSLVQTSPVPCTIVP